MIYGMITVRSQSTRLPEKCYLPFGEGNVIEHMIKRAKHFDIKPIVCTTLEKEDDRIVEIAKKEDVLYFRGSTLDKLSRWRDACRKNNIEKFISIDADDPFFDYDLSLSSIKQLNSGYDLVKHSKHQPNYGFYEGCVGYSIKYDIIDKACKLKETHDTEMMWSFIEKVPNVKISNLDSKKIEISHPIRLTLDYAEDYWLMKSIERILGPYTSRKEIVNLFISNPDLYKINWFRNDDYNIAMNERIQ